MLLARAAGDERSLRSDGGWLGGDGVRPELLSGSAGSLFEVGVAAAVRGPEVGGDVRAAVALGLKKGTDLLLLFSFLLIGRCNYCNSARYC